MAFSTSCQRFFHDRRCVSREGDDVFFTQTGIVEATDIHRPWYLDRYAHFVTSLCARARLVHREQKRNNVGNSIVGDEQPPLALAVTASSWHAAVMPRVPNTDPKRDKEIARLGRLLRELQRIPQHLREAECADERERSILAMIADLRRPIYRWTTSDDEVADDAIMVGIGGTSADMLMLGMGYVEPTAAIYWCARVTPRGIFDAGGEMQPRSVPDALCRAEQLREKMGYDRVVVTLAEAGLWQPKWGRLAIREGF
ncbi:hypothetical protein VE26_05700 [Devosia chinhatensis]|uniref:Uncharacterized protein n=2 Tax=Devosia chinhatensis TaxID=429727 RepID=A0A0F5FMI2_9HYPH|nr:hypothetical protein VE26_05700 [Devosia chinhatensis]